MNYETLHQQHFGTPPPPGVSVGESISIGTDRDDLIRAWERATPCFERRTKTVSALCEKGLFVVVTLSPFALWNDLAGTMHRLNAVGVAYVTILFFRHSCQGARTPALFLDYLRANYAQVLDPKWQAESRAAVETIFGSTRVLEGRKEAIVCLHAPNRTLKPCRYPSQEGVHQPFRIDSVRVLEPASRKVN